MTQAPKQKRCLAVIREGVRVPLRSSNTKTRDDDEPGRNRHGARTQEGNWVTLRGHREGLFSRRS